MLPTLHADEDLDLSSNRISRELTGKLVAAVSHLPLRRLALANCGLEVVSTLAQMHSELGVATRRRRQRPGTAKTGQSAIPSRKNQTNPNVHHPAPPPNQAQANRNLQKSLQNRTRPYTAENPSKKLILGCSQGDGSTAPGHTTPGSGYIYVCIPLLREFGSLRELDLSRDLLKTMPMARRLQPLLGRLTMLRLEGLMCWGEQGVHPGREGLLRELQGSGADLREFRFGLDTWVESVAAFVRRCLMAWPQLRVLDVCWPERVALSNCSGKDVAMPWLQELTLQCLRVEDCEHPAAQRLPLLTKVVIQDMRCSLQGECALGGWLGEMPSLRVLQICGLLCVTRVGKSRNPCQVTHAGEAHRADRPTGAEGVWVRLLLSRDQVCVPAVPAAVSSLATGA